MTEFGTVTLVKEEHVSGEQIPIIPKARTPVCPNFWDLLRALTQNKKEQPNFHGYQTRC